MWYHSDDDTDSDSSDIDVVETDDVRRDRCLRRAIKQGDIDTTRQLWTEGGAVCPGSLCRALRNGHYEVVRFVVDAGYDISDSDIICVAVQCGDIDMVRYLVERGGANPCYLNNTPMDYAVYAADLNFDIVTYLHAKGADLARVAVALAGHVKTASQLYILDYLIAAGIDVLAQHMLDRILSLCDLDVVSRLQSLGADFRCVDLGAICNRATKRCFRIRAKLASGQALRRMAGRAYQKAHAETLDQDLARLQDMVPEEIFPYLKPKPQPPRWTSFHNHTYHPGGLMNLIAYGAQDVYLTSNPTVDFFHVPRQARQH